MAFYGSKDWSVFYGYDTTKYIAPALSLITTGQFSTNGIPETTRTPGYPILMVPGLLTGFPEMLTIALQILLGCLTIYLIFRIGLTLFERPLPALSSAALYAIEPLSVIYTNILMSETLFSTTLVSFLLFFLKYLKSNYWGSLIVSATFLAVCAYIRPICYFLPLLMGLCLVFRILIMRSWNRKAVLQVMVFLLVIYVLLLPWQVRNYYYTGQWSFSGISSDDLYFFTASTVLAQINKIPYEEQREQMAYASNNLYLTPHPEHREWTGDDVRRWRTARALEIITSYPFGYIKMVALGATWTVGGPGIGSWVELFKMNRNRSGQSLTATEDDKLYYLRVSRLSYWGSIFLGLVLGAYWIVALVGGYKVYRQVGWQVIFLGGTVLYFVLVPAMLAIGYSRFRHPVTPILCVLGGYYLSTIIDRWKHWPLLGCQSEQTQALGAS